MQSFAGQVGIRIIRPSAALRAPRAVSRPGASGPASSPPCDVGGRNPSRSPKLYRAVTRSSTGPRRTTTTTRPTWPGTAPAPLPLTRSPPPRRRPASPRRLAHRLLISRPPLCVTSNPAWPSCVCVSVCLSWPGEFLMNSKSSYSQFTMNITPRTHFEGERHFLQGRWSRVRARCCFPSSCAT